MPRSKSRRRGRPNAIAKLSVTQLMGEIERRRSMAGQLHSRRAQLEQELSVISDELAQLETLGSSKEHASVSVSAPKRGRPKGSGKPGAIRGKGRGGNEKSLSSLLQSLLTGKTMSVPKMAEAVKKSGYKSKSKNFRTIVALTLLKNKKAFKRVARGQYTAKS